MFRASFNQIDMQRLNIQKINNGYLYHVIININIYKFFHPKRAVFLPSQRCFSRQIFLRDF